MGETSLNGWAAIQNENDPRLQWIKVPGTNKTVCVRREAAPLFAAILSEINKKLIPLDGGPLDGWEYRQARAANALSNHSSASAVDYRYDVLLADNNLHWPASKHDTMHKLMDKYVTTGGKRVFGWGGDWTPGKYADEMHLELIQAFSPGSQGSNCTLADVQNVIKRLGIRPDGTISTLQKVINVVKPKPKAPLSAHQAHLAHLAKLGQAAPASPIQPKPAPKPVPAKPAALTPHQLHVLHMANHPAGTPAPVAAASKGPDWLVKFLRAHKVPNERAWFAIGMRESGGDPSCIYPAGSPKNGWATDQAPYWDSGWAQVNNRHYSDVARLYGSDMRAMLNAENCLDFALKHLAWSDWGLEITSDAAGNATGFKFNWAGWPSPYQPGQSGAVGAEAGFKQWWDAYPTYAAKVK